jgi:hypothetical protein
MPARSRRIAFQNAIQKVRARSRRLPAEPAAVCSMKQKR